MVVRVHRLCDPIFAVGVLACRNRHITLGKPATVAAVGGDGGKAKLSVVFVDGEVKAYQIPPAKVERG